MSKALLVPIGQIAQLTGLSERTIQRLAKDGIIAKPQKNHYSLAEALPAIIRYYRDGRGAVDENDLEKELLKAQIDNTSEAAREKRLKNKQSEGELLPATVVEQLLSSIVVLFRTQALQFVDFAPELLLEQDAKAAKKRAYSYVEAILNELSRAVIDYTGNGAEPSTNEGI